MLKSIDPILNAEVLYALRAMGHGDDLVIVDTNFPADAVLKGPFRLYPKELVGSWRIGSKDLFARRQGGELRPTQRSARKEAAGRQVDGSALRAQ